jgi:uncharacterized protein (DUF433 family)
LRLLIFIRVISDVIIRNNMMQLTQIGLYTPAQAALITKASIAEIKRWLFGYTDSSGKKHQPLWHTQISDDACVIGFRDLMELRVVKTFTSHGVPIKTIRTAIAHAKELFNTDHPFTSNRFLTDGKSIFYEAIKQENELTDLLKKQLVFEDIIRPSLYSGIEFSESGITQRWYPVAQSHSVVLDPDISFGRPSLTQYGIPTETIYRTFQIEGDAKIVANQYDIPVSDVMDAILFEQKLVTP